MPVIKVDWEKHGPLFTKDIRKTVRENIRAAMDELAQEGETAIRELTPVGPGRHEMHLRDSIIGRTRALKGKKWAVTAVVSPTINQTLPNYRGYATYIETGVRRGTGKYGRITSSDRAGRGTFRGARMFSRGVARMRGRIKAALADLTKGLE